MSVQHVTAQRRISNKIIKVEKGNKQSCIQNPLQNYKPNKTQSDNFHRLVYLKRKRKNIKNNY